jgi:glycosyltransferase involved in cell wall biosynthesis
LDIKLTPIREKENSVKRFGFVGRINPIKNIDLLLEAWAKLGNKTENCELIIAGEGNAIYKKQLTDFVSDKGLKNVVFCGFLSGNDLTEMVSSFDYQLLVSKSENFGMVIPEALVCGVPCIATQGTPWKELNSRNCGWWIDNNRESIADAIKCAINTSSDEYKLMANNAINLVKEKYSIDKTVDELIKLYKQIY